MIVEESTTRETITRIVMLAEALFEVIFAAQLSIISLKVYDLSMLFLKLSVGFHELQLNFPPS